jgi:heptosyltransferase-3
MALVRSGGPTLEEIDYLATIQRRLPEDTINLAGQASLAELAGIIGQAKLYIGPDTGITHLAATTGVPVIALYGPSNPAKWSPWPYRFEQNSNPFDRTGSKQVNNVSLIQGQKDCVPCQLEGCDRHRQSRSLCLDSLSFERVKQAITTALSST